MHLAQLNKREYDEAFRISEIPEVKIKLKEIKDWEDRYGKCWPNSIFLNIGTGIIPCLIEDDGIIIH